MAQGTIEKVTSKDWKGKKLYSFKVGDVWYGAGNSPVPGEGTYVSFEATQNDKGYWQAKNVKVATPPAGAAPSTAGKPGQGYWDEKEQHYRARWAVSAANEFALKSLELGLVEVPAKAKPEEKRVIALALAGELAVEFAKRAANLAAGKVEEEEEPAPGEGDAPATTSGEDKEWAE